MDRTNNNLPEKDSAGLCSRRKILFCREKNNKKIIKVDFGRIKFIAISQKTTSE